jgi:hypothetical protein
MNKYLVKKYGELNYSIMILRAQLEMLVNSKANLSKTIMLENLTGLNCLIDILGESLDASMDELSSFEHENLIYDFEQLTERFHNFTKDSGFSI